MLVAYAGAWIMNLSAFFFLNRITLSWFNLSPESNAMALQVMVWFNIISLFIWPSSFTLPNILRAAGDATFTMTVSVFSMWVFRVGFCYLMVLGLAACSASGAACSWTGCSAPSSLPSASSRGAGWKRKSSELALPDCFPARKRVE